jgi:predicted NUDIX family phosphoesterase
MLPYCQRHGEECEAGALSNFWDDAHYALDRVDKLHAALPSMLENPLAALIIQDADEEAFRRVTDGIEERHEAEQSVGVGGHG